MSSPQATASIQTDRSRSVRTVVSVLDLNPRKFGSMEEYMALLARALCDRGWRCVFVLPEPVSPDVMRYFDGSGAIFEIVPDLAGRSSAGKLRRVLRKYPCDIVHFHFFSLFTRYPIIAWLSGCPRIVFTQHSRLSERPSRLRAWKGMLWDRCVLRPTGTKILTVAAHLQSTLTESYRLNPANIRVLHNGVNLRRFQPVPAEETAALRQELLVGAGKVIVAAAYLVPGKGMRDLVAAAPVVLRKLPDAVFVIAGDGPELVPLQALARQLGVADQFRFPGLRSDLNRFMALADVVVMPSVFKESAGLVAVEAMASARPVVGTRVGGIPELVSDGECGILVDPQAPEQIAAALIRLLTEPGLSAAMGTAGRKRAEKYFSADRWIHDTIAFYEESLS